MTDYQFETIQRRSNQPSNFQLEPHKILCQTCQHPVTTSHQKIEIDGQHSHQCTNPGGVTYELGCFSTAPGCIRRGIPTVEFTWFTGYYWNFALCANCLTHLGWFYQKSSQEHFHGLILANLQEFP
jgi:hypothetical protein